MKVYLVIYVNEKAGGNTVVDVYATKERAKNKLKNWEERLRK